MFTNIMSTLAAAQTRTPQQSRPAQTHGGCTMEAMEDRLLMAIVAVNGGGNTPNGEANGVPMSELATYVLVVRR